MTWVNHTVSISLENEEIGDLETVTTWRSKEDVADWAKDPTNNKEKSYAMVSLVLRIRRNTDGLNMKKEFMKSEPKMEYKKIEINTDEADKFGILIENLLRHCTKK